MSDIYHYKTMAELSAIVNPNMPVYCDTETKGLYGEIRLLQVMQFGWDKVILVDSPNHLEVVGFLANVHSVWHNAHYDLTTIAPRFAPAKFDDTFLLSRLAQPQFEKYSLDAVIDRTIGYDPYEMAKLDKKVLQKSNWAAPKLSKEQELYAALDVYHMPEVWADVKHKLDDTSYILDKSNLVKCLDFQCNGMPVQAHRIEKSYNEIIKKLRNIPWVDNGRSHEFVSGKHKIRMPFNPNSHKQVREALDLPGTNKQLLADQAVMHGNQEAQNVMDARSNIKLLSFMSKYDTDRLYGKLKPSARSGRYTSDDENLQQIPRALKEVFGTTDDRMFVYSDYAQLELRTICAIIGVSLMEKLFRDEEDLHGYVASILFGEGWTKADRQVTKTYNFNLLYGGSVGMVLKILVTYGLAMQERQANRHKAKWLNLFPELNRWQQECISKWRKGRLNKTPLGREYKAKLMTDFMNIMNQGAGAEVSKLAMHYYIPKLADFNKRHNTDAMLCNFVHDSFITECDNNPAHYEELAIIKAECMQEAWFEMSKLYKIKDLPMPVNVLCGQNWGDIEKGEGIVFDFELDGMAMYRGQE